MTERLLDQYSDSPNVINLVDVFAGVTDLQGAFDAMQLRLSIDDMEGYQLDRIGFIVGRPRPFLTSDNDESFAFEGAGGLGFNEGVWRSSTYIPNSSDPADDGTYRRFLRAAILRNYSNGSMPDIVRFIDLALDKRPIILNRVGYIEINFPTQVLSYEVDLLQNNLPLAAGIGIEINDNVPPETLDLDYRAQEYLVGEII